MTENQLKFLNYQEAKRHNRATESLGVDTLSETARSNLAREDETYRHNDRTERQQDYAVAGSFLNNFTHSLKNVSDYIGDWASLAKLLMG